MPTKLTELKQLNEDELLGASARDLPNNPTQQGISADAIKRAQWKPSQMLFTYLQRSIVETNKAIEDLGDELGDSEDRLKELIDDEEEARESADVSLNNKISVIQGYFENGGKAKKAVRDGNGNTIATTYATSAYVTATDTALSNRITPLENLNSQFNVISQKQGVIEGMLANCGITYNENTGLLTVKVNGTDYSVDLPLEMASQSFSVTEDGNLVVEATNGETTSYSLLNVIRLIQGSQGSTVNVSVNNGTIGASVVDGSLEEKHFKAPLNTLFNRYESIVASETSRASAELTRQGNEADRQENERNRLSAEDERASAETARATAFASMQTSFNALQSSLEASEYRIALLEKDLAEANFEILTLKHFVYDTIVSEAEYDFSYLFLEPIPTSIDGHLVLQNGEIVIEQAEGNSYGFNQQLDTISYWGSVLSVKKNADGSLVVNGTCGSSTETIYLKNNNTMNTSHKYLIGVDKQGSSTTYGLRHGSSVFYGYLVLNGNNGAVALDLYQNYVASNLSLNIAIIDLTAMGEADISSVAEFKSRHPEIDLTKPLPYCKGLLKSIGSHGDGTRIVENQVCNPTKAWEGSGASCTSSGNDFSATITSKATWVSVYKEATFAQGHKYLVNGSAKASEATSSFRFALGAGNYTSYVSLSQDEEKKFNLIATATSSPNGYLYLYPNASAGMSANATLNCNISSVIDLTLMFGSGKEPSSLSEFLALRPHYFEALHPYDEGTEMSLEEAEKTAWVMENQVAKINEPVHYQGTVTETAEGYKYVAKTDRTSAYFGYYPSVVQGHKYLTIMRVKPSVDRKLNFLTCSNVWDYNVQLKAGSWFSYEKISTCELSATSQYFNVYLHLMEGGETIEFAPWTIIDLTAMFGYGNEPTSVDEFKARLPYYRLDKARPYNAGTLRALHNTEPFAIEVKGGNILPEQYEGNGINTTNGNKQNGENNFRTASPFEVKPNTAYTFTSFGSIKANSYIYFIEYGDGLSYIKGTSGLELNQSRTITTSPTTKYLAFQLYKSGSGWATNVPQDPKFMLSLGSSAPTSYVPHRGTLLRVDLKPFPDGDFDGFSYERHNGEVHIRKDGASSYDIDPSLVAYATINEAGSVSDRIYARLGEDGLYEIVKETKVGSVDLGSLAWSYVEPASAYPYGFFSCSGINGKKQNNNNITANGYSVIVAQPFTHDKNIVSTSTTGVYAVNSAYTSASTFKSAMSGVTLFYELATPTTSVLRTGVHQSEIFGLLKSYPASAIEPLRKAGSVADRLYFEQYAEDEEGDRLFRLVRETKVKCVDLGSVSMTYNSTSDYYYFVANDIKTMGENVLPNILATYTTVLYTDLASSDKCVTQSGSSNIVRVKDTSLGSSTQPKGCLLYELATPVTEVLRDNLREDEIACLTEAGAYLELKGGVVPSKVKTTLVVNKLEA